MKRLLTTLERWSAGKPKPLVWLVAAALCWLLLGALVALPFAVPAFGLDPSRDDRGRSADGGCAQVSEAQPRQVRRLVAVAGPPADDR